MLRSANPRDARVAHARPAPEDADTLEEQPPASVVRVAARADVHPRDDKPEPPTVEPALGLLGSAPRTRTPPPGFEPTTVRSAPVGIPGSTSEGPGSTCTSSPDAAACRARRIEDDFEPCAAVSRPPRDRTGGGDRRGESRGRRVRSRRTIRKRAREPQTFPDRSRAFDVGCRRRRRFRFRRRRRRRFGFGSDARVVARGLGRRRGARGGVAEVPSGRRRRSARRRGGVRARAPSAPWPRDAREPRRRTPARWSRRGSGLSGSGRASATRDALRRWRARMEANDRGAGGDAETNTTAPPRESNANISWTRRTTKTIRSATGEFGAGDRGAGDRSKTTTGHHRVDARARSSRTRAGGTRGGSRRALSRARSGAGGAQRFLRRLARIGVPSLLDPTVSPFPDGQRRRAAARRIPSTRSGSTMDAELERARASRRAGEDPGESLFARFARGRRRRRGGRRKHAAGGTATSRRREGIFRPRARASNDGDAATRTFSGRVGGGAEAGCFVRRVRARSSDDGCEGCGAGLRVYCVRVGGAAGGGSGGTTGRPGVRGGGGGAQIGRARDRAGSDAWEGDPRSIAYGIGGARTRYLSLARLVSARAAATRTMGDVTGLVLGRRAARRPACVGMIESPTVHRFDFEGDAFRSGRMVFDRGFARFVGRRDVRRRFDRGTPRTPFADFRVARPATRARLQMVEKASIASVLSPSYHAQR